MSTPPLTIVEHKPVLRPAAPDRPGGRRHQSVVVWNLDGTLTHRGAEVNGRLTGGTAGGDCHGAERARRVLAQLTERPAGPLWGYGNLPADRDLLDLADIDIRVRPLRHLYAMSHS